MNSDENLNENKLLKNFEILSDESSKENISKKYVLSFDVGGTTVKCAIVDENKKVIAKWFYDTYSDTFIEDAYQSAMLALYKCQIDKSQVLGVGMGVPGKLNESKDMALLIPSMKLKNYMLKARIQNVFGKDMVIRINNDVEGALKGEMSNLDVDKDSKITMVTLGTGFGGAYFDGKNCDNVEPGHMYFNYARLAHRPVRKCNCGKFGCIEAYCNQSAVIMDFQEAGGNPEILDVKAIFDLAKEYQRKINEENNGKNLINEEITDDEKAAFEAKKVFITDLENGIMQISEKYPSSLFIIGGGISKSLTENIDEIEEFINRRFDAKIIKANFSNDAGIIGNAVDVIDYINQLPKNEKKMPDENPKINIKLPQEIKEMLVQIVDSKLFGTLQKDMEKYDRATYSKVTKLLENVSKRDEKDIFSDEVKLQMLFACAEKYPDKDLDISIINYMYQVFNDRYLLLEKYDLLDNKKVRIGNFFELLIPDDLDKEEKEEIFTKLKKAKEIRDALGVETLSGIRKIRYRDDASADCGRKFRNMQDNERV